VTSGLNAKMQQKQQEQIDAMIAKTNAETGVANATKGQIEMQTYYDQAQKASNIDLNNSHIGLNSATLPKILAEISDLRASVSQRHGNVDFMKAQASKIPTEIKQLIADIGLKSAQQQHTWSSKSLLDQDYYFNKLTTTGREDENLIDKSVWGQAARVLQRYNPFGQSAVAIGRSLK
jgi:hypothetical protein